MSMRIVKSARRTDETEISLTLNLLEVARQRTDGVDVTNDGGLFGRGVQYFLGAQLTL